MAGEDTRRLILQVDASVELARRNLVELSRTVDTETKKMDGDLGRVDKAHQRLAVSSGSARASQMEMMHVVRASSDAFAAGIPVQQIFFSELGRVAEAASMAGGAIGKLGAFLGGPYGLLVSAAVAVIGSLVLGHHTAGAAADDHRSAEEKLLDAIKKSKEAAKTLNDTELLSIQRSLDSARARNAEAESFLKVARARLADALAEQRVQKVRSSAPGQRGEVAALSLDVATRSVAGLEEEVAKLDKSISDNAAAMGETQVKWARILAEGLTSREAKARQDFDRNQIGLEKDYRERTKGRTPTNQDTVWLAQQEAKLVVQRDASIKAAQDAAEAERKLADTRQSGRHVTIDQAADIARSAGFHVNSAGRPTWIRDERPGGGSSQERLYNAWVAAGKPRDNPVAVPGTSAHEGARGQWALDVQKSAGATPGSIRSAFAAQGVTGVNVFGERGHWHVSGSTGRGSGPSAETVARREESAAERKRREDADWAGLIAGANDDLLKAKRALADAAEDQTTIAIAEVRQEQDIKTSQARERARRDGKSKAEADLAAATIAQTADAKVQLIRDRAAAKTAQDRMKLELDGLRTTEEIEQLNGQLADTAQARRDSARHLLDISEQMERIQLRALIADKSIADDDERKVAARARLDALPEIYADKQAIADRQNESPGQSYLRDLRTGLNDVNDRIEAIGVKGLQGLEDSTARSIAKVLGLKGALGGVLEELIKIGLEKAALGLADLAGFLSGGGSFGSQTISGFAAGGDPPVGRVSMVGEKGPELFVPKVPGTIIPNHALRGSAAPQQVVVSVEASEDFNVRVVHLAGSAAQAMAPQVENNAVSKMVKMLTQRSLP